MSQDVNFSGDTPLDTTLRASTDWDKLDLQQVASRRNVGGWSVGAGYWDAGYWDAGATTESASGYWDAGYWDAGYWDAGYWDAGYWDAGYWDAGYWDAGVENEAEELDLDTAVGANTGPNSVSAAIFGKDVRVTWAPPVVGSDSVSWYEVYRVEGTTLNATNLAAKVRIGANVVSPSTQVIDTTAKNNVNYIYIALAVFNDGRRSGIGVSPVFIK
jgi:hypothetical protein